MTGRAALVASVENDPNRTSAPHAANLNFVFLAPTRAVV
jgi:hypothetical protein